MMLALIVTGMGWVQQALFTKHDIAMGVVLVIVVVGVDGDLRALGVTTDIAKQGEVRGIASDLLGMSLAANMLIEADDGVSGRHHQV